MNSRRYDVLIVGASIAGCTAAIAYARAGLRVCLLERHADNDAFKQLCTHYIQASATPILRRLGIAALIEAAGGIRNLADIHTQWGWLVEPNLLDSDGEPLHGYSMTRERLDPLLKQCVEETANIDYFPAMPVRALLWDGDRVSGVIGGADNTPFEAALVVAADGRNSTLAGLAKVPAKSSANCRGGVFAYYRNLGLRGGKRAQMWLHGNEVGYIFPNEDNISVVAAMPLHSEIPRYKANPAGALEDFIQGLDEAPDFSRAERLSDVFIVKDYPNQTRPPIAHGMALIGDAAASIDPLFGVGCGWAIQTADWLVEATAPSLRAQGDVAAGLRSYARRHRRQLAGHVFALLDFSKRDHFSLLERLMFSAAAKDAAMMRHVTLFATRYSGLGEFLSPRALLRAIWVNLTHAGGGRSVAVR